MTSAILQVTESPADVKLVTRVTTINDNTVTLGSSIECDLILTAEQSLSDEIWASITPSADKGQYLLKAHVDDVIVNGRPVISSMEKALADGDIIAVANYTVLFSCEQAIKPVEEVTEPVNYQEIDFDANNILAGLGDAPTDHQTPLTEEAQAAFLAYDELAHANNTNQAPDSSVGALADKIDHLLEISQNPWIQQKKLLSMLDGVVDEFIKEFDPALIEEMVGQPSFFNSGKQWQAYKKYFQRKHNEGHFKRQFKALLIECLQK
ncbi:FHA domain-containing protein [Thalassotalea euphylliae]|uniref:FHA domain-containing protein n=1 Tax=Thalassotalea euphylliae TaxID=1655234 RepID=A0A3E0U409_9GAMM|nr:FHA domain-containing protein [Thalassotalea euphylliae]REL30712.1 hypothetical protein DXX94_08285 [Thalassotalea euphylliae]